MVRSPSEQPRRDRRPPAEHPRQTSACSKQTSARSKSALLSSADARVRALAAEVAGTRPNGARYAPALIDRLQDSDLRVRDQARLSLRRIAGKDPAEGEEGEAAQEKWRALFREGTQRR